MPFLHGVRDTVIRDQAGTLLQEEPRKDGRSGRDNRRVRRQEWNKGPRFKEQLHLRKERTFGRIFGKTIGLEIVKRRVGSSVRIRKTSVKTLWRSRPMPKRKKGLHTA
jgi:hypothetical protein